MQAAQLELAAGQPANTNALAIRRPFDPRAHDLDAHFRLTRFADLKGWGCKVPQEVLLKLLEGLQDDANSQEEHHFMHMAIPRIGEYLMHTYSLFNLLFTTFVCTMWVFLDIFFNCFYVLFSGIGMDSSITPLRHGGLSLVQTTDFFYPLVEDPYMQGVVSF